jgi:hypothetical protein
LIVIAGLLVGGGVARATSGGAQAGPPTIQAILACKDASAFKCVGQFSLGIPSASPKVDFLIYTKGIPKGAFFTLNVLDATSHQPLGSPIKFGPQKFDPAVWRITFRGPFAKFSMQLQVTYQGKTLPGTFIFRFV